MQYLVAIITGVAMFLALGSRERLEIRDSFEFEPAAQTVRKIRWPRKSIELAFSNSLLSPGANIKPDSDVVGAARRALLRWSSLTNINFVVTWTSATSVSPADAGDGVSLITIAATAENEAFNADATTGRTRVFFDSQTGSIAEADIVINPRPRAGDGTELQFSTDGTPGTYDLEATFTHEIGHLLGLDHSAVLSSTMQSRQAFNGTFGLPALTERTLSEDDRQKIRSLYGAKMSLGRIEGKLVDNRASGMLTPLNGVNVWAESVATGRVIASAITADDGSYRLESLTPGQYRVMVAAGADAGAQKFRSFELSNSVMVKAEIPTPLNSSLIQPQVSALNPRVVGLNAELSTVALPLTPGKRVKVYLGGDGVDQVPGTSIAVNSPYFSVDPATLAREQIPAPFPIVSIEVQVAANVPFGDYSIRLQSNSGEVAFVPGAITIDPGVSLTAANPVDDFKFFISQQYTDLGREADHTTIDKLNAQLALCNNRADCLRARRVEISTDLLIEDELPATGVFLYGLYSAALGRAPRFAEFESDRPALVTSKTDRDAIRLALATALVERPEFKRRFAATMKSVEFVDSILMSLVQGTGVDLGAERSALIGLVDEGPNGRAAALARIAADQRLVDANYNHALVLFQYFTHLRRNPDEAGYIAWVNTLKSKPLRDPEVARSLVCNFLNSAEYQNRFGMVATRHHRECN